LKDKIIKTLEKYEDEIMKNTLGDSVDEDDQRYASVYVYEWTDHKHGIAWIIEKLLKSKTQVSAEGFAYIIISQWTGVMTFQEGDLNIKALTEVCAKILKEL